MVVVLGVVERETAREGTEPWRIGAALLLLVVMVMVVVVLLSSSTSCAKKGMVTADCVGCGVKTGRPTASSDKCYLNVVSDAGCRSSQQAKVLGSEIRRLCLMVEKRHCP